MAKTASSLKHQPLPPLAFLWAQLGYLKLIEAAFAVEEDKAFDPKQVGLSVAQAELAEQ